MGRDTPSFESPSRWSPLFAAAVLLALGPVAAHFMQAPMADLKEDAITTGLTNVATVAGVSSGLSLAGLAVLSLQSENLRALLREYGGIVRYFLFGGYAVVVTGALLCGFIAMFPGWPPSRWILVAVAVYTLEQLILTALLISNAYAWHNAPRRVPRRERPGFSATTRS
ncbi:hypothetical protein ACFP5Z_04460 [Kocuria oceani]